MGQPYRTDHLGDVTHRRALSAKLVTVDFEPMPRRDAGAFTQLAGRASNEVAKIDATRESHAQFWDAWNVAALKETGPLWVALGDSSTQGIGASDPEDSWVPNVLDRLRHHTGEPWRVINLSITGGQFSDVVAHQLPRIDQLSAAGHEPALATAIIGANNLLSPRTWRGANAELREILHRLPSRSVVARVGISSPMNSIMARRFTHTIEKISAERGFENFWPWDWPSRDGMAEDKFHPNPTGYEYMADLIWDPLLAVATRPS